MTEHPRRTPNLRRALLLADLRNPAHLTALLVVLSLIALFALLTIRIPARIDHVMVTVLTTTPVEGDNGTQPVYTARDQLGRTYPMVSRDLRAAALLTPGDVICLRVQTDRFTGRVTARHDPGHPDCGIQ